MKRKVTYVLVIALATLILFASVANAETVELDDVTPGKEISIIEVKKSMEDGKAFMIQSSAEWYKKVGIDLSDPNVIREVFVNLLDNEEVALRSYDKPVLVYHESISVVNSQDARKTDTKTYKYGSVYIKCDLYIEALWKEVYNSSTGEWWDAYKTKSYLASWSTNKPYTTSSESGGVEKINHYQILQSGPDPDDNWVFKNPINDSFARTQDPSASGGQSGRTYSTSIPYSGITKYNYGGLCYAQIDFYLKIRNSSGTGDVTPQPIVELQAGWGQIPTA